ncbi:MAG TPA: hypothetical protein VFJ94_15140 [Intrasporangium sp.]|uniref:hypothetical protein n=1 Tax=Intrasporangium sp. TaxID=1925024 RepID=UPI002D769903|nr:hypothetical protein [Intrasporangium sp.]HET7399851.1 hypothetical protein [Intrasporangium sp.]
MFSSARRTTVAAITALTAVTLPVLMHAESADASSGRVRYGINSGGWWKTGGQSHEDAYKQAVAAYGQPGFMRLWPNRFNTTWRGGLIPTYVDDAKIPVYINLGSDVAGVNNGTHDAEWIKILQTAPRDRWIWFSFAHEPEGDGFTVADWQKAQMRLASLKTQYAPSNVKFAPLLMGTTFMDSRYKISAPGNVSWSTWFNFDLKDVDALGADIYQWGKSDASADAASTIVSPVIEAAQSKGKGLVVGELGARNTLSDAGRAKFLTDAVNLFDAARNVRAVAYFENDNGALGPWNLLPKPGVATLTPGLVKSVNVWKTAIQSSPKQ